MTKQTNTETVKHRSDIFFIEPKREGFLFFKKYRLPTVDEFMDELKDKILKESLAYPDKSCFIELMSKINLEVELEYQKFLYLYHKFNGDKVTELSEIKVYMAINPEDMNEFNVSIYNLSIFPSNADGLKSVRTSYGNLKLEKE